MEQEVVSAIINVSEHVEDYNSYYGASKYFGDLRAPKNIDCTGLESCRACRIASINDQEDYEKNARKRNSKSLEAVKSYFDNCFDQIKHQEFSKEDQIQLDNLKNELESTYNNVEKEIDKTVVRGKELKLWRDLDDLYGNIDDLYSMDTFGNDHINDKPIIKEEWKKMTSKVESFFYQLADHVDEYGLNQRILGKLLGPKSEMTEWRVHKWSNSIPCNEENKCKKCLECPISNINTSNNAKPKSSDDPTIKILKPYSYARSKVNFTMQDIDDPSDQDNYEIPSDVMLLTPARCPPKRSCNK